MYSPQKQNLTSNSIFGSSENGFARYSRREDHQVVKFLRGWGDDDDALEKSNTGSLSKDDEYNGDEMMRLCNDEANSGDDDRDE